MYDNESSGSNVNIYSSEKINNVHEINTESEENSKNSRNNDNSINIEMLFNEILEANAKLEELKKDQDKKYSELKDKLDKKIFEFSALAKSHGPNFIQYIETKEKEKEKELKIIREIKDKVRSSYNKSFTEEIKKNPETIPIKEENKSDNRKSKKKINQRKMMKLYLLTKMK